MMNSKNVPKIRFKGFSGEWEKKAFKDIVDRSSLTSNNIELNRVEYEDIVAGEGVLNKDISQKVNKKIGMLFNPGDILFGKLRPYLKNYLLADFRGIALGDFWILNCCNNESSFIYTLIQCDVFQIIANTSTGTKMPRSDWAFVSLAEFNIPTLAEQTQIGNYFQNIDTLINTSQNKLDKLKNIKKACLEKMFPKKGSTIPEIRFKGFTGEWEEKTLGEIGYTQSGIGFPDKEQGGTRGIPFFKVSDMNNVGNEYVMTNANNYVLQEQVIRKNWMPIRQVPAIIFAKVGAAIMLNRKRLVSHPFLLDNNMMTYIFDVSWNEDFGRTLFETIYLPSLAQVGALPSYNGSDVSDVKISIPANIKEQEIIGNYFKNLDDLLSKNEQKLTKLKNIKKGCLEKMFVNTTDAL